MSMAEVKVLDKVIGDLRPDFSWWPLGPGKARHFLSLGDDAAAGTLPVFIYWDCGCPDLREFWRSIGRVRL